MYHIFFSSEAILLPTFGFQNFFFKGDCICNYIWPSSPLSLLVPYGKSLGKQSWFLPILLAYFFSFLSPLKLLTHPSLMPLEATKKFKWPVRKYVSVPFYHIYVTFIIYPLSTSQRDVRWLMIKKKKKTHMSNSTVKNSQKGKSETI